MIPAGVSLRSALRRTLLPQAPLRNQARGYARLTLIGYLVKDAQVLNQGVEGKEFVALKVASADPLSKAAREAGKEATASYFDVLAFNRQSYLAGFEKGSLVHAECDVRLEPTNDESGNYLPPKVRLTLRDINKLRKPAASSDSALL